MAEWQNFLSTLAQASVALLALLFVSFQLARDKWIKDEMRKRVATQTSLEFMAPFLFALSGLLPETPLDKFIDYSWQIGATLGSLGALFVAVRIVQYGRKNELDGFGKTQLQLQWMVFPEYIAILYFTYVGNLEVVALIMSWLLISGSYEAWLFFTELSDKSEPIVKSTSDEDNQHQSQHN